MAFMAMPLIEVQKVNFSVAVNERWKNRSGESQERTTWLRIIAFNGVGAACAEYLRRGDPVYVEGRLQIREYDDKDGKERTAVEVVATKVRFLGGGHNDSDEKRPAPGQPRGNRTRTSTGRDEGQQVPQDTEVPF